MDCNLLGSSVHEIFQARILERVAIAIFFSRGSSPPRDWTHVSSPALTGRFSTTELPGKPQKKVIEPIHLLKGNCCMYMLKYKWSEGARSCPTLCDSMDCSLLGSSFHRIFQAGILEWAPISFSRGSSRLKDWTQISCIADRCFTVWATREAHLKYKKNQLLSFMWT